MIVRSFSRLQCPFRLSQPLRLPRRLPYPYRNQKFASTQPPETDKSRILEKPDAFRPPSHGRRRTRLRAYPGPRLSDEERARQQTKRYPNMMPPPGTFLYYFLTNRMIHMWITLSVLTILAAYSMGRSFLHKTIYRAQLPAPSDFLSHPSSSFSQFLKVYKLHVAHETEVVADRRRRKQEDVKKREEFLKAHGVEPGFLTGSWMDRFGTVEGDIAKKEKAEEARKRRELEEHGGESTESVEVVENVKAPVLGMAMDGSGVVGDDHTGDGLEPRRRKWLGIW